MNRGALAAVIVVILAAFAGLAVSVVNARRTLDGDVNRSFHAVASRAGGTPYDCEKPRISYYACDVLLRPSRGGPERQIEYTIFLRDSGCWTARPTIEALQPQFRALAGCIAND